MVGANALSSMKTLPSSDTPSEPPAALRFAVLSRRRPGPHTGEA